MSTKMLVLDFKSDGGAVPPIGSTIMFDFSSLCISHTCPAQSSEEAQHANA